MGGEGGIQSEDRRLLPQYGRWYTRRLSLLTGIDYKLATLTVPIAAQTKRPPKTAKYNKSDRGTMDLFNCRLEGSFCGYADGRRVARQRDKGPSRDWGCDGGRVFPRSFSD